MTRRLLLPIVATIPVAITASMSASERETQPDVPQPPPQLPSLFYWGDFNGDSLLDAFAIAAAELVKLQGGQVAGFSFLVELAFLKGEERLAAYAENIHRLVKY